MGNRVGGEENDTTESEILRAIIRNDSEIVRNWIRNGRVEVNERNSVREILFFSFLFCSF
jgi:hypothetical protein